MYEIYGQLTESFILNCRLFGWTLLLSIPLGLLIAFGAMNRFAPLRWLIRTFVWIIRGTPLMLQVLIIFYMPGLMGWSVSWAGLSEDRFIAATVAFTINYACYFSEIFRGGIQSVPRGQYEAGQVLGMTKSQIFFKVTLLQMIKRIMPPTGNEVITLVKDTTLVRVIAVPEILMAAGRYLSKGLIWPYFAIGLYFLVFVGGLTLLFGYIEKKLDYFRA